MAGTFVKPFEVDDPFNQPFKTDSAFLARGHSQSVNLQLGGHFINDDAWTIPIFQANPSDPMRTITGGFSSPEAFHNGSQVNFPRSFRCPDNAVASPPPHSAGYSDGHMVVIDDQGVLWSLFRAERQGNGNWIAQFVQQWNVGFTGPFNYTGQTGLYGWKCTIAAGWSAAAGVVRANEWQAARDGNDNAIKHMLVCGVGQNQLLAGPMYPAGTQDNQWPEYSGQNRMGTIFGLDPSFNIEAQGWNSLQKSVAYALRNYGGIIGDTSGAGGARFRSELHTLSNTEKTQVDNALGAMSSYFVPMSNQGTNKNNLKGTGAYVVPLEGDPPPDPNEPLPPVQPDGTLIHHETFTGSNGSAWPAVWARTTTGDSIVDIQSNRGRIFAGGPDWSAGRALLSNQVIADGYIAVDILMPDASIYGLPRVNFRCQDNAFTEGKPNNGYMVELIPTQNTVELVRVINGQRAWIAQGGVTLSSNITYRLLVEYNDTFIGVKLWDASLNEPSAYTYTVEDDTYSEGLISITAERGNQQNFTALFDNFYATSLVPSGFATPTNFRVTGKTQTSISLAWNEVEGADFYQIERDGIIVEESLQDTTYTDSDLNPNTEYVYRVRAARSI